MGDHMYLEKRVVSDAWSLSLPSLFCIYALMASWKQPIPTDLHLVFGDDHGANLLYRELIYRASNEERIICVGSIRIKIKRGETLFSQSSFADFLQWNGRKCSRVLEDLCDFYKKVSRRRQGKYTVVELLNYDELINFVQEPYRELTRRNATPKSVKSVKSDKIKEYIYIFSDEVEKLFQELLLIRKAKKTPNTERAVESLRKKAQQVLYQEGEEKLLGYLDESILNGWKSFAYNFKAIEGKRHISREEEQELIKKSQLRTFLTPSEDE